MEEADEKSTDFSVSVTSCEQAKWKILSESLLIILFPRGGDQKDEITDSNQKDGMVQKDDRCNINDIMSGYETK